MMTTACFLLADSFEDFFNRNPEICILGIFIIIIIFASCASNSSDKTPSAEPQRVLQRTPENLEQYTIEVKVIRKLAQPFRDRPVISALAKQIRRLEQHRIILRIDVASECLSIRFQPVQDQPASAEIFYSQLNFRLIKQENCIPVACALTLTLGNNYHIRFADGKPTASLILNPLQLLDPNEKTQPQQ